MLMKEEGRTRLEGLTPKPERLLPKAELSHGIIPINQKSVIIQEKEWRRWKKKEEA